jgi:hypothetical protein
MLFSKPNLTITLTLVNGNMYVFGGRTDIYITDNVTADGMTPIGYHVYSDLWKLELPRNETLVLNYTMNSENSTVLNGDQYVAPIPQNVPLYLAINGSRGDNLELYGDGLHPRKGKCIKKIELKMSIYHPCINQLRVFLKGPGDLTGSPNYYPYESKHKVILFDTPETNGTGCSAGLHSFVFDDSATRLLYACCTSIFGGVYKPNGPLNEFLGNVNY